MLVKDAMKQASQYLSGQRGERDTGAWHSSSQTRDKRADGDHRGELNTQMRTAAVSPWRHALATKVPAILGTKRRQVAFPSARHVRNFTKSVFSYTRDRAKAFAKEHGCTEDAVRAADVVVTATSSQTSVLQVLG